MDSYDYSSESSNNYSNESSNDYSSSISSNDSNNTDSIHENNDMKMFDNFDYDVITIEHKLNFLMYKLINTNKFMLITKNDEYKEYIMEFISASNKFIIYLDTFKNN